MEMYKDCNAILYKQNVDAQIEESQNRYNESKERKMEGVPVVVKDNFTTLDLPTSCGSKVLENYISPFEAESVRLIKEQGGIIMAKTNMDEFGMGSFNLNSAFGPCFQPCGRLSGGSSGGSAVAIQTKMAHVALGSDTGGSVRFPALMCKIFGFKPSRGSISRYGLVPYAHSMDTVGIFANNINDVETTFDVLNHPDEKDHTSQTYRPRTLKATVIGSLDLDLFQKVDLNTQYAVEAYYDIVCAEVFSNLSRYDGLRFGKHRDYLGNEAKRRINYGKKVIDLNRYSKALKVRERIKNEFQKCFETVSVLVCYSDLYLIPVSLAGLPSMVLPNGLQIIAPYGCEKTVFEVSKSFY